MGINAGDALREDDFEDVSTGAPEKIPVTDALGQLHGSFIKDRIGENHVLGALANNFVKLYFNAHLRFLFATGALQNDAATSVEHWQRTSSSVVITDRTTLAMRFAGTGDAFMHLQELWFNGTATAIGFNAANVVIMDWWMKKISGTGYGRMGFEGSDSYLVDAWNANSNFAGFYIENDTLYANTSRISGNDRRTDISAGVTLANWNNFRIEFDLGAATVRFYVNGVLKHTDATDSVPISSNTLGFGFGRDTTNPLIYACTAPYMSIEMNP